MKECVAEPNLRLFFENLLKLKAKVAIQVKTSNDKFLQEIYADLEKIIKEAK